MREFSIVRTEFWTGRTGRELRQHPAEARELACYLFSAPGHEMYGLYYKPIGSMVIEIGRSERSVQQSLVTLEALDYCAYDPINEWVWVKEMAQIQLNLPLKPLDYKVAAANKWYQTLPRNAHLGPFFDRYCDSLFLKPPRRYWSPHDVSVTKHTESEGATQEPLISISTPVLVPMVGEVRTKTTERFDRFWAVYPKKVGKKSARIEWDRLRPDDDLTDRIVAAVERHRRSERWLRDNGRAIPDPERYIKNERWNDNYEAGPTLSKQTLKNVQGPLGSFLDGF